MATLKQMIRHPSRALEPITEQPRRSGGVILLLLAALGLYWVFPEIRRYVRIERM